MKELLENIIRNLVDLPDSISVNEIRGEQTIILELKVAQQDMGKVIGKEGRIAQSIRTILNAIALHQGKRVNLEIIQAN